MDTFYSFNLLTKDFGTTPGRLGNAVPFICMYKNKGRSFIHNLDPLIRSKAKNEWKGEYVILTSLRNYLDVYLYNNRRLPIDVAKLYVPEDKLYRNRLLWLTEGEVIFYHEEY